ncbi:AQJ64_40280 family protein [Actinoplanes sp. RD1]|uniref:AQJ64_40280 family protein n=1 Tax=Actinoplanes sp. RD1 TaxID=3064538 RepID=UPI002741D65B|nr:AQJ64_40280 family protein [Actinoplanes sp. RD1]
MTFGTDAVITWIDARQENPPDGRLVLAAVTGRYPSGEEPGEDFWLVIAAHFRSSSPVEGTDRVVRDRYWDSDGVIRKVYGSAPGEPLEEVTHWAALPSLPGQAAAMLFGAPVPPAVTAAMG